MCGHPELRNFQIAPFGVLFRSGFDPLLCLSGALLLVVTFGLLVLITSEVIRAHRDMNFVESAAVQINFADSRQ